MLALLWNLSAAIRGYLRFYMPTNRALDWLRTPRGLSGPLPVVLVATPAYLFAMSVCAVVAEAPCARLPQRAGRVVRLELDEIPVDCGSEPAQRPSRRLRHRPIGGATG